MVTASFTRPVSFGRTLHLLDIENLLRGHVTAERVAAVCATYASRLPAGPTDVAWAGFGAATATHGVFALPNWIRPRVGGNGADAADLVLGDLLDPDRVAGRYTQVVLGSADHFFLPQLVELTRRGNTSVTIVTTSHPHRGLLAACHRHVWLQAPRELATSSVA